ncbi:probable Maltose permease [Fusarium mangiferae]|uniref:Probable Maltose permease n=1 Tax=Fusarium mangiferae TaxID=192010 RepID=A0A1L7T2K1_FUSMA|nr:putative Maltose permease [Fusarium mangiferae]CVK92119.1 probable Maltose permease [Fusarium mangiferae]
MEKTIADEIQDIPNDIQHAREAVASEHGQTVKDALRTHYKAVFWSLYLSMAVIMEGYDTSLIFSFLGLPAFAKRYGTLQDDGLYSLSAPWQSALGQGAMVGQFFGLIVTGYAADWYGFRRTAAVACILNAAFILILFFSPNVETLFAGQVLLGLPLGVFLTLTTVYTAEVSPLALRPYLETWVNICWSIGKLMASGVLRAYSEDTTEWAYRVPWAVQWIFPPFIVLGVYLAPESPWWHIRQSDVEAARESLLRLSTGVPEEEIRNTLSQMILTNMQEKEAQSGTSYWDCFRGTNLRRTEICCLAQTMQPLVGFALVLWTTSFFQLQGLSASDAFNLSIGQNSLGFVAGILLWFLMPRLGRRTIYLWGLGAIFVLQMTIGALGVPSYTKATAWSTGALIMAFYLCYMLSVGPMSYVVGFEIPSTRLRNKTAILGRNAYHIGSVFNGILTTYMISPAGWKWQGKTAFFWAGFTLLAWVWTFFRLPEIKGRVFAELDYLFENRVPARVFASTRPQLFSVNDQDTD